MRLPIDELLPAVRATLRTTDGLVIEAPPGAGKTTRVPTALLAEPWLGRRRIIVLEPRRLAASAAASFMAAQRGERVGGTVGYRTRLDTRVSRETRLEVVTEGVLTRMIQSDPSLDGIGAVIFDEFHERSLHADLGLALCLQARELLRPELRIVVMSATLDGEAVARLIDAPRLRSEGRTFLVETHHLDRPRTDRVEAACARAVLHAIDADDGDVLVFLPGAAEIRRTAERLAESSRIPGTVDIIPLYGDLPGDSQERAIRASPAGRRKVVLATAIAETSLTIDGVRVVIDGGLMRVPRFSPRTGLTRLETVRVTRDAADQRRGRAGRTAPGVCYRLWTEAEEAGLVARRKPEILEADLAGLALELAAWGVRDPTTLRWLDPPPAAAYLQARELLAELGALDVAGSITAHGRTLAGFPAHPRLAQLMVRAKPLGLGHLACDLAALLGERDILRSTDGPADADVRLRIEILNRAGSGHAVPMAAGPAASIDHGTVRRVRAESRAWNRRLEVTGAHDDDLDASRAGELLALAWPDRIARRRPRTRGRFILRNGRGAHLPPTQLLAAEPYIVCASLAGHGRDSLIHVAAPIDADTIRHHFADDIETRTEVKWHRASRTVRARRREVLGAVILADTAVADPDPDLVTGALLRGIRLEGLDLLPWTDAARAVRQRLAFLHGVDGSWPALSDQSLLDTLEEWLGPYVHGVSRIDQLRDLDLARLLLDRLTPRQRIRFDEFAPTHITVPSGSRIAIDYSEPAAPALPVRLQEMFGLQDTPRIAGGAVALTLRLLSPAMRPVQVTRDLASFWRSGYFEVRRDLRGRYPKHFWPEDPLTALPTRRTRPRR